MLLGCKSTLMNIIGLNPRSGISQLHSKALSVLRRADV
jgi:hypothetical protein